MGNCNTEIKFFFQEFFVNLMKSRSFDVASDCYTIPFLEGGTLPVLRITGGIPPPM